MFSFGFGAVYTLLISTLIATTLLTETWEPKCHLLMELTPAFNIPSCSTRLRAQFISIGVADIEPIFLIVSLLTIIHARVLPNDQRVSDLA